MCDHRLPRIVVSNQGGMLGTIKTDASSLTPGPAVGSGCDEVIAEGQGYIALLALDTSSSRLQFFSAIVFHPVF